MVRWWRGCGDALSPDSSAKSLFSRAIRGQRRSEVWLARDPSPSSRPCQRNLDLLSLARLLPFMNHRRPLGPLALYIRPLSMTIIFDGDRPGVSEKGKGEVSDDDIERLRSYHPPLQTFREDLRSTCLAGRRTLTFSGVVLTVASCLTMAKRN